MQYDLSKYDDIEGEIELALPTYRQRLRMLKQCNVQVDDEGNATLGSDSLDMMLKMIDLSVQYYQKVDVQHGDIKAESFEELEGYRCFDKLIADIANFLLQAGQLGE